ncbi:MAG: hypothetical protein K2N74_00700 [Clostridiales bacterium]|nr:hypothetical protein [Clostridiales bacterium]
MIRLLVALSPVYIALIAVACVVLAAAVAAVIIVSLRKKRRAQSMQPAETPVQKQEKELPAEAEPKKEAPAKPAPAKVEPQKPEPVKTAPAEPVQEEGVKRAVAPAFMGERTEMLNKSFTAKIIQLDEVSKQWYSLLKNELLSYRKVRARMSWKRETYRLGRKCAARFVVRGKRLCLQLALSAESYAGTRYRVEDISDVKSCADAPCLYRIKNARRAEYAKKLIADVMAQLGVEKAETAAENYVLPFESTDELIARGLIKKILVVRAVAEEEAAVSAVAEETVEAVEEEETPAPLYDEYIEEDFEDEEPDEPEEAEEEEVKEEAQAEPASEKKEEPQYNKSFTAKVIQLNDISKRWYSRLKNELLSYGDICDVMSWKRESFRLNKKYVARFMVRGKTLCLLLALDPKKYGEAKLNVRDVSKIHACADTPSMLRLKNERSVKHAVHLISEAMRKAGTHKVPHEERDYYIPYATTAQLVEQGLVRSSDKKQK